MALVKDTMPVEFVDNVCGLILRTFNSTYKLSLWMGYGLFQIDRARAGVNEASVGNAKDPMPTGQREVGTILLSPSEDGHYNSQ